MIQAKLGIDDKIAQAMLQDLQQSARHSLELFELCHARHDDLFGRFLHLAGEVEFVHHLIDLRMESVQRGRCDNS